MFTADNDKCPEHLVALRNLLAGNFHQDLMEDFGSFEAALSQAVADASDDEKRASLPQIDWLISQNFTEAELIAIFRNELYCDYLPERLGPWLRRIRSAIEIALAHPSD